MLKNLLPTKPGTEPLAEAFRACRIHFVWAAIYSALINILYLTPTLYMMQVYDRVVPTGGVGTLILITAIALFALASLAGLDWLRGRLMLRAGLRLDRLLAAKVLGRVVDLQAKAPNSQALREFDSVRTAITGQGVMALFDAPWTPIYMLCCFLLHPWLGLLNLVGGVVLFVLAWLNEKDTRPRLQRAMQLQNSAYQNHEYMAGQTEILRALGMRGAAIQRQVDQRELATLGQADAQLAGGRYSGIIKFLRLALQSAVLGLAALLAVKNQISAGSIIAASVLLSRSVAPIEQLVGAWPGLVQGWSGWKNLTELFSGTAGVDRERTQLPNPKGALKVEGASVQYPGSETPQLRGASLTLKPGQTLGVIGPSGSGKTTLARIIAGALKPQAGKVRLDGADYEAWDGDSLARWIGYLPQASNLFAGTIKDNISRFTSSVGVDAAIIDRKTVEAGIAAGAHELILSLPKGYDTELGPYGQGLSAGQSQRVALARALYDNPSLLVLDEPNSNLDQDGETALMQAVIAAAARGASVVIIAHRAGVLARVDRLLLMRDGMIQLEGPREEVLEKIRAMQGVASEPAAKPANTNATGASPLANQANLVPQNRRRQ